MTYYTEPMAHEFGVSPEALQDTMNDLGIFPVRWTAREPVSAVYSLDQFRALKRHFEEQKLSQRLDPVAAHKEPVDWKQDGF